MGRLITARVAEINKGATLKIANRVSNEPISTPYGEMFEYGELEELDVNLTPLKSLYEAEEYGVELVGSFKAILTKEDSEKFNAFTHIWLETEPDSDKQQPEYIVSKVPSTLNYGLLVIVKVPGVH